MARGGTPGVVPHPRWKKSFDSFVIPLVQRNHHFQQLYYSTLDDNLASYLLHEMTGAKIFSPLFTRTCGRENRPLRPDPMGFYLIFNIINSQAHQQPMNNKNAIIYFYSRIDSRCFPELRNDLFWGDLALTLTSDDPFIFMTSGDLWISVRLSWSLIIASRTILTISSFFICYKS